MINKKTLPILIFYILIISFSNLNNFTIYNMINIKFLCLVIKYCLHNNFYNIILLEKNKRIKNLNINGFNKFLKIC